MNNELERIRKEDIVDKFEVLHWHVPSGTEENYDKPQSE